MLDLDPAAREVVRLLDGVTDDRLADPTPADIPVAALLDHLVGLATAFAWAAHKTTDDHVAGDAGPPTPTADHLDPDWRTVLPRQLDELVEAWRDPAAWEGLTKAGGVTMPAEQMAVVALDELVLHGWDLARATGQEFRCDPTSTEAILAFTTLMAQPENAAGRTGLFGPVVTVPDDAPPFDRALGLSGRDPEWTP